MTDLIAIRLFEADGGLAEEWHAQDQITRNHYEKLATAMNENLPPEVVRWQRAYRAANGKPAPSVIYWGRGWYTVDGRPKRRAREFAEWAERLESRVLERAPERAT